MKALQNQIKIVKIKPTEKPIKMVFIIWKNITARKGLLTCPMYVYRDFRDLAPQELAQLRGYIELVKKAFAESMRARKYRSAKASRALVTKAVERNYGWKNLSPKPYSSRCT